MARPGLEPGTPRFSVVFPCRSRVLDLHGIATEVASSIASTFSRILRSFSERYGRRRGSSAFSSRRPGRSRVIGSIRSRRRCRSPSRISTSWSDAAIRTPPTPGEEDGRRYWRYVELRSGELESNDLEILRRIDPTGAEPVLDGLGEVDLEAAWQRTAADVVEAHNRRADVREEQEAIGPRQRWALDVLRDPGVAYAPGAEDAEVALSVGRSSAVRKALAAIEISVHAGDLTVDDAAAAIVALVEQFGLQAVEEPALPRRVTIDELGVVCWMAVLPPAD
jgi:hypothetical protein